MTLHLTPAAKSSLKSIGRYTEMKWGKTQRNKYLRELDNCFQTLAKHPEQGRARNELSIDLRSCHVNKHVVFYLSRAEETIIVDVLHERMDPDLHLILRH